MSNFVGATLVVARPGPTRMPRSKEADSAAWRMVQTLRKDQVEIIRLTDRLEAAMPRGWPANPV